jgi:hypothetical protein
VTSNRPPPVPSTRQQRQRAALVKLVAAGELNRAFVLGREHLLEFPDDLIVHDLLLVVGPGSVP